MNLQKLLLLTISKMPDSRGIPHRPITELLFCNFSTAIAGDVDLRQASFKSRGKLTPREHCDAGSSRRWHKLLLPLLLLIRTGK